MVYGRREAHNNWSMGGGRHITNGLWQFMNWPQARMLFVKGSQ